ncbi:nucleoside 5-triphosphatase RdgB (dHAPTP, dITP,XTP-specific), partial [Campylobacter jejuni]|nr:nucleoside 5-triphosphatase RdgB (dHAPTP, dITP,XTP-specific) [Campylobacter jejuni]
KEFFQGRDEKGKMNNPAKAKDEYYKALLSDLNANLKILAKKIEPKIYEYGFLKE